MQKRHDEWRRLIWRAGRRSGASGGQGRAHSSLRQGAMLLAERPPEAITVDAVVDAAGVAKGTFYYHFQSIDELAAAVGAKLGESFDEMLTPARLEFRIRWNACLSPSRNSWNGRSPTPTGRGSSFRARSRRLSSRLGVRDQPQGGHLRSDRPGPPEHAGRRAGSRHRDWHMAAGHTRHPRARRPTRIDTPGCRGGASRAWGFPVRGGRAVVIFASG